MVETKLDAVVEKELPITVSNEKIRKEGSKVVLTADFSPRLEHSEFFVDVTEDRNPIHKEILQYGEAISPGFLQTSAAILLARKVMREAGVIPLEFPFLENQSQMTGAVITGKDYKFWAEFNPESMESKVTLINERGRRVYSLGQRVHQQMPEGFFPELKPEPPVYVGEFKRRANQNLKPLFNIIGSDSQEGNLYLMSISSSAVFAAMDGKKIGIEPRLVALYSQQNVNSDVSESPDLNEGVTLELYLTDAEQFGKIKGETMDMWVRAKNKEGKTLYVSHAPVSFQDPKILRVMMKRAKIAAKEPREVLGNIINRLHEQYGDLVTREQAVEWLGYRGFSEVDIEPAPMFTDMPRTKFIQPGTELELTVHGTSGLDGGPEFAVLMTSKNGYHARFPPKKTS